MSACSLLRASLTSFFEAESFSDSFANNSSAATTSSVSSAAGIFDRACISFVNVLANCPALQTINISTWNTSGAPTPADRADMFANDTALEYLILGPYVNLTGTNL